MRAPLAGFCLFMASMVPAHAAQSFVLPDPSGLTLFALGVAGLIIGRRVAARRKDED
ncbi:MAG: PEP-CTERM sorting domain-containing protein [Novosphingobium sp.]|nr:PEP-CTERM sorting domain-containing protein [Novosphingobium sp.]